MSQPKKTKQQSTLLFMRLLTSVLSSHKELSKKLESLEQQVSQIQELLEHSKQTSIQEEEYSESIVVPLSEELYLELCKALGSDKMPFMAIA